MSIVIIITPGPKKPPGPNDRTADRPVHHDYAEAREAIDRAEEEGASVEVRE